MTESESESESELSDGPDILKVNVASTLVTRIALLWL